MTIQQLMFGGVRGFSFDAVTSTGQFDYVEHPSGDNETVNYSAATMTSWFNDKSFNSNLVPQSSSGTLTVNFSFTVPSDYKLYLAARMGNQMNRSLSVIKLNGSNIVNGWSPDDRQNAFIANSGTAVSTLAFIGNVSGSGNNDGYVVQVGNFVLVPNTATVTSNWSGAEILSNVAGAVATGG